MNNSKIALFPKNLAPVLKLMRSRMGDELEESLLPYETFVDCFNGHSLDNPELEASFWDALFDYLFSAEGTVAFLIEVRRGLIGNVKNETQYIRAHNKIKYPLINDLPALKKHVISLAEEKGREVDPEWIKTVDYISLFCRFRPYQMSIEDAEKLAQQKKLFNQLL